MAITSFKDLRVWQMSVDLAESLYFVARQLPTEERFGLASQMQRAAVSIPSNIAEGSKRSSRADYKQFCKIALGSAAELETQLVLVRKLYPHVTIPNEILHNLENVQKMLASLASKLNTPLSPINEKR